MKISFQYPARVTTGYCDHHPATTVYYNTTGSRTGSRMAGPISYFQPTYGVRLKTAVVFDRELYLARRAKAVGKLALLSSFTAVAAPLALLYVAGEYVGRGLNWFGGALSGVASRFGALPGHNLRSDYRILWADLTK